MDTDSHKLMNIIVMVSPIEHCITPPPDPSTPEDISPLTIRSTLERHHSTPNSTAIKPSGQDIVSPSKNRKGISRRNTAPAIPRLNTSQNRRSSLSLDRIFTPRPLEAILTERAYLISSLHRQTVASRQLIGEYSSFEADLAAPQAKGKARRNIRKKLNHLRAQLDEAAGQEKTIFVRLGEVYTELQSHAAWSEAALWRIPLQQQHRQPDAGEQGHDGYFQRHQTCFSPEEQCYGPQNTPLDPEAPAFVPGQPIYAASDGSSAMRFTSDLSNSSTLETVDETSEDECSSHHGIVDERERGLQDDDLCGGEDIGLRFKRRLSYDEDMVSSQEKRLSLPNLHTVWPEV